MSNSSRVIDDKVASVVDKKAALDEDEDDLIAQLENDDSILDGLRERRLEQLHQEYARARSQKSQDYGSYTEIKDEKAVMDLTTSAKYCVVHFFHHDFHRCDIMSKHLTVSFTECLLEVKAY